MKLPTMKSVFVSTVLPLGLWGSGGMVQAQEVDSTRVLNARISAPTDEGVLPTLNLEQSLRRFYAEVAEGRGVVVALGDSITFRDDSWCIDFRRRMQAKYGDAGKGWQPMSVWTGAGMSGDWERGLINEDTLPYRGLDGLWGRSTGFQNAFIDLREPLNRLFFSSEPVGGAMTVEVAGSTSRLNGRSSSLMLRWLDLPRLEPENRRVWLRPENNGPVTVFGAVGTTGNPGVLVHKVANGSWGVDEFLQRDWTFEPLMRQLDPDVIVLMIGQNDWAYPAPEWEELLERLCNRLTRGVPGARLVIVSTYQSVDLPNAMAERMERARVVAERRGIGFVDLQFFAGSHRFFVDNDLLRDPVHFNDRGACFVGKMLFDAFETRGESMSVEVCGDADFDNDGVVGVGDLDSYFSLLNEGPCLSEECDLLDINRDAVISPEDLDALLRLMGGERCRVE